MLKETYFFIVILSFEILKLVRCLLKTKKKTKNNWINGHNWVSITEENALLIKPILMFHFFFRIQEALEFQ